MDIPRCDLAKYHCWEQNFTSLECLACRILAKASLIRPSPVAWAQFHLGQKGLKATKRQGYLLFRLCGIWLVVNHEIAWNVAGYCFGSPSKAEFADSQSLSSFSIFSIYSQWVFWQRTSTNWLLDCLGPVKILLFRVKDRLPSAWACFWSELQEKLNGPQDRKRPETNTRPFWSFLRRLSFFSPVYVLIFGTCELIR